MSHARRFHGPGVGARTGMKIDDGMFDLGDFIEAGRRAMNQGRQSVKSRRGTSSVVEESVVDSEEENSTVMEVDTGLPGSSSMMIVQSECCSGKQWIRKRLFSLLPPSSLGPGPSPRSTIRRSQAPSSSPFLSSPGTARNLSQSPQLHHTYALNKNNIEERGDAGSSSRGSELLMISSPSKARAQHRSVISAGLEARREKKRLEEERVKGLSSRRSERAAAIASLSGLVDSDDDGEISAACENGGSREPSPLVDQEEEEDHEGYDDYETSIAIQQFPTKYSEGLLNSSSYLANNDNNSPDPEVKKANKAKESTSMRIIKEKKVKASNSRVLKEKNGLAIQSLASPLKKEKARKRDKKDDHNGDDRDEENGDIIGPLRPPQKKHRVEERRRGGSAQREVVERIPSSHHRQLSLDTGDGDGLRRGSRYRYKPLEYWRGEKARFGRPSLPRSKRQIEEGEVGEETIDGDAFEDHFAGQIMPVAVLKEIIRVPREEGEGTFSGMKIKRGDKVAGGGDRVKVTAAAAAATTASTKETGGKLDPLGPTRHAEEGWDKETEMKATVWDADTKAEAEMQIACPFAQVRPRLAVNSTFGFEKVFVVDHAMATGVLYILVDGQKPLKNSKENNYTFVVLEGAVRVHLHKTKFVIAPHGMFFVPRGNDYSIENIASRTAKVAFTQCRGG